jgi:hypothetical protein
MNLKIIEIPVCVVLSVVGVEAIVRGPEVNQVKLLYIAFKSLILSDFF